MREEVLALNLHKDSRALGVRANPASLEFASACFEESSEFQRIGFMKQDVVLNSYQGFPVFRSTSSAWIAAGVLLSAFFTGPAFAQGSGNRSRSNCQGVIDAARSELDQYLTQVSASTLTHQREDLVRTRERFLALMRVNSALNDKYENVLRNADNINRGVFPAYGTRLPEYDLEYLDPVAHRLIEVNDVRDFFITYQSILAEPEKKVNSQHPDINFGENLMLAWQTVQQEPGLPGGRETIVLRACSSVEAAAPSFSIQGDVPTQLRFCSEIDLRSGVVYAPKNGNPIAQIRPRDLENRINGIQARAFEIQFVNRRLTQSGCRAFSLPRLTPTDDVRLRGSYLQ